VFYTNQKNLAWILLSPPCAIKPCHWWSPLLRRRRRWGRNRREIECLSERQWAMCWCLWPAELLWPVCCVANTCLIWAEFFTWYLFWLYFLSFPNTHTCMYCIYKSFQQNFWIFTWIPLNTGKHSWALGLFGFFISLDCFILLSLARSGEPF
jgi:hypothetical protein